MIGFNYKSHSTINVSCFTKINIIFSRYLCTHDNYDNNIHIHFIDSTLFISYNQHCHMYSCQHEHTYWPYEFIISIHIQFIYSKNIHALI